MYNTQLTDNQELFMAMSMHEKNRESHQEDSLFLFLEKNLHTFFILITFAAQN